MEINTALPNQWRDLATLEARVASGNLQAVELESIAEELAPFLYSTSNKVRQIAQEIFDAIVHAKHVLIERDCRVISRLERLQTDIQTLWLTMGEMTPEEIAEEIVALSQQMETIETPTSARLRTLYKAAGDELEKLKFHFTFPIVDELEPSGPFAMELMRIAHAVREGNSSEPLKELTSSQRAEIDAQIGSPEGLSSEGLAHAVEGYLEALRTHAEVARAFYSGQLEEGLKGLLNLPQAAQEQIDQILWEETQGEGLDPLLPEFQALLANGVLQAMEQRMGLNDEL